MKIGDEMTQDFWNNRWANHHLAWDIGFASPPIVDYMKGYPNKHASILIPGCGNAYEVDLLLESGFTNITLIDIAAVAVKKLQQKYTNYPGVKVIHGNFFDHVGAYDLIIEQTFFCAILPNQREDYASKASDLLAENGRIIGLLFNTIFEKDGPPFGGDTAEYRAIFEKYFTVEKMENCILSIPQRAGREVFIELLKK